MERVIAYIDGFNLYYGLRDKNLKWGYWLNLPLLMTNLLKPDQQLIFTKYFTSIVKTPSSKHQRQNTYIEALKTLPDLEIFKGHFLSNEKECPYCHRVYHKPGEKMTDVNIAVQIIIDATKNNFDNAFLVSADSDLVDVIKQVQNIFGKKLTIVFPPARYSKNLKQKASGYIHISQSDISKSLLPEEVTKPDGYVLKKPI